MSTALAQLHNYNSDLAGAFSSLDNDYARKQVNKMRACSHQPGSIHHCGSPLCLLCARWKNENENLLLKMQASGLRSSVPKARLLSANFTIVDTWPGSLRETAKRLSTSWRGMTGKVQGLVGSFRTTEIATSKVNPKMENVHIHGILAISAAHSGRSYWSRSDWRNAWRREVGVLAKDLEDGGVKVQTIKDIDAVIDYILPWGHYGKKGFLERAKDAISNPTRYVERVQQLHGLPLHLSSGRLYETPPDPAEDLTGLAEHTRSKFRAFQHRLARELNPKSKTPYEPIPIADD